MTRGRPFLAAVARGGAAAAALSAAIDVLVMARSSGISASAVRRIWKADKEFRPNLSSAARRKRLELWRQAVDRA